MARWHRKRRRSRFDIFEWAYQWRRRLGVIGMVSIVALAMIAAAVFILEARTSSAEVEVLREYIREAGVDPVAFIANRARAHRLVLLGDVEGAAAPKRLAAEVIEALATGPGLDAVVLAVPSELQPVIDRYLNSREENASLLVGRPALLREWAGASTAYMEIYRTVWRLNRELGPGRSIRIVAADLPEWPPRGAISPRQAAELYARRPAHMAEKILNEVLEPFPRARVLVFAGGYQVLQGAAELKLGGADPIPVVWLAARLEEAYPSETYSVLVEGTQHVREVRAIPVFGATRVGELLAGRVTGDAVPAAVPVDSRFDVLSDPIPTPAGPGLEMEILPRGYRLSEVIDAYVYLGPM